jgi:hypothetical protein
MVKTAGVVASRMVGFLYGIISLVGGAVVFVLFVRIPSDLLYLLPPGLGRLVVNVAPWLVTAGTGQPSGVRLLGLFLFSLVFVVFGLWSLGKALFGSFDSFPANT